MCNDHIAVDDESAAARMTLSRRNLLRAAALTSLSGGMLGRALWAPPPAAAASVAGAYSMAMHIHSSFSELYGTMNAHLNQAKLNNVDVIWWTDHDTKMNGKNDRQVVHFSSLTDETGDGTPWKWTLHKFGSHTTAATGGVVASPASPKDTVPAGSLQVTAQSTGTTQASLGFHPVTGQGKHNWRTNLTGQTLSLEVLPTSIGPKAYLELAITSSYHPASGGRPAGKYSVSYRFGGTGSPGQRQASKTTAIVTVGCTPGVWNSVVLRPDVDLKAVFPDLDSRDFSLFDLRFNAVSKNSVKASGNFDYLRFTRQTTGEVALDVQDAIMATYASRYPTVKQHHGVEASYADPHVNWFGGAITLPNYQGIKRTEYLDFMRGTVIRDIHNSGGLASYNHPFGTGDQPNPLPKATQDQMLRDVAISLVTNNALDTDILEVGYPLRAGVDLAHHIDLWDVCSRNGMFLTANGVSDDHYGDDWTDLPTWTTSAWAANNSETALLNSLKSGQAWCGSMLKYRGALDLLVDGECPMGSVSVSTVQGRDLTVTATTVPAGGSVDVVQRVVDYPGPQNPTPGTPVIKTLPASAFAGGTAAVRVDTNQSSFVRTQVKDSTGTVIALSNPVWLLRENPPGGRTIPAARAC